MRNSVFVPMIALGLLLTGCSGREAEKVEAVRDRYREMAGCTIEAEVRCTMWEEPWSAVFRCAYAPGVSCVVEALAPETIAGVQVLLDEEQNWYPRFQGGYVNAGDVSRETISPASCLPRLLHCLREGWLLEECREDRNGVPCLRLTLDEKGEAVEKICATLWLRQEDGLPVRGEIAVEGETVLTADVTAFAWDPG